MTYMATIFFSPEKEAWVLCSAGRTRSPCGHFDIYWGKECTKNCKAPMMGHFHKRQFDSKKTNFNSGQGSGWVKWSQGRNIYYLGGTLDQPRIWRFTQSEGGVKHVKMSSKEDKGKALWLKDILISNDGPCPYEISKKLTQNTESWMITEKEEEEEEEEEEYVSHLKSRGEAGTELGDIISKVYKVDKQIESLMGELGEESEKIQRLEEDKKELLREKKKNTRTIERLQTLLEEKDNGPIKKKKKEKKKTTHSPTGYNHFGKIEKEKINTERERINILNEYVQKDPISFIGVQAKLWNSLEQVQKNNYNYEAKRISMEEQL